MKRAILIVVGLVLLLVGVGQTKADLIIGNLPGNDVGGSGLIGPPVPASAGVGFTMTSGTNFSLTSVTLRLNLSNGSNPVVQIYSNNGSNLPGTLLTTLANPSLTFGTIQDFVFTPPSPFTLDADTSYWIVLSNSGQETILDWAGSFPAQTPTGPDASSLGSALSSGKVPPTATSSNTYSFEVDGTPAATVPEPTSLALFGMSTLAGAAYCAWRRRQQVKVAA